MFLSFTKAVCTVAEAVNRVKHSWIERACLPTSRDVAAMTETRNRDLR